MAEEKTKDLPVEVSIKEGEKTDDVKKETEIPKEFKDLVTSIEKMTVLELSELVKVLEDKFGVSSVMPMMMAGGGNGAGEGAGQEEESSIVNIELTEGGGNKIAVIKALRVVTELGLKDAKDYKRIMESETISEEVKDMIRGLVEIKGKKIIQRK